MKIFKFSLIITGIAFLAALFYFVPNVENLPLFSIILLSFPIFIFGTILLALFYGDKLSRWLAALIVLSLIFLFIPWGGDYTPIKIAQFLYLLFGASVICSWLWLVFLYKSRPKS
jgi:hypothetical protein